MASACITVAEWIEWKGGPCPLTLGQTFDIEYRDGLTNSVPKVADAHWMHRNVWRHFNDKGDIVRYRITG